MLKARSNCFTDYAKYTPALLLFLWIISRTPKELPWKTSHPTEYLLGKAAAPSERGADIYRLLRSYYQGDLRGAPALWSIAF